MRGVSKAALRNQLPDFRHAVVRNVHNGLGGLDASFVLDEGIVFGLLLVKCKDPPSFLLVSSFWKIPFAHCCFFFLRLRNATRALPLNSYAIITNTLSGSGSGT